LRREKGLNISIYHRRNVSNIRWAFSILIELIKSRTNGITYVRGREVRFSTGEAEEAALRIGMAKGTARAALTVLSRLGVVSRIARGRWVTRAAVVRASWPGEALLKLAGAGEDGELSEARRTFLRAAYFGWLDGEEREHVRQVAQAAFKELWERIRRARELGLVILGFVDLGMRRDREGMEALARYLVRALALACAVVYV